MSDGKKTFLIVAMYLLGLLLAIVGAVGHFVGDASSIRRLGGPVAVGDITSVAVSGAPLGGGGTAGAVTIDWLATGCVSGETWIYNGTTWTCEPAGGGGSGDLTEVQASSPLTVTNGTGPIPSLAWSTSGVTPGETWFYTGSAWVSEPQPEAHRRWGCRDDFFTNPATTIGTCVIFSASGATYLTTSVEVTHPAIGCTLLDAATDRFALIPQNSTASTIAFGAGANHVVEWLTYHTAASNGTDTYVQRFGFLDVVNADAIDGAYFELDANVDPEWQCKTAANSTRDTTDSGVTAAIDTWYRLRVEVDAASAVRFYINGTQVCGAHPTTNIPSGATRATQYGAQALAAAGTGARNVCIDYMDYTGYATGGAR